MRKLKSKYKWMLSDREAVGVGKKYVRVGKGKASIIITRELSEKIKRKI